MVRNGNSDGVRETDSKAGGRDTIENLVSGERLMGISLPVQPHIPLLVIPLLFVVFFIGAAGEELGYMGYAIDPMQERWGALTAGLIMGSFWALWHVPALLQTGQTPAYIAVGLPAAVGTRILIIWLYNNTGKSVFAGILFHVMALFGSSFVATSASGSFVTGMGIQEDQSLHWQPIQKTMMVSGKWRYSSQVTH